VNREATVARLASGEQWDVVVVGGGATGLGIAVDASSRGYHTALVERHDFAKGTSSRSTKLVHGGVRYLRNGQLGLVRGALLERGRLERNAPHLVRRQPFVIPIYRAGDFLLYGLGLKVYEWLSGAHSFGASQMISAEETRRRLPTVQSSGLRGGVVYHDGQFDDAGLALALAQTAAKEGAAVLNYAAVEQLTKRNGRIVGVLARDVETGAALNINARVVINATGVFTDAMRLLDDVEARPILAVSSGVHLVLDCSFLPGTDALMIPKTADGRVLFAVPWQGRVVVGTTDEPRSVAELEPKPLEQEVDFLLTHASRYLEKTVTRSDVRSVFVGLRPLVKSSEVRSTASLSRDHAIVVSESGLLSITGGKWTTYRKMAEDAVNRAATLGGLPTRTSRTAKLPLWGAPKAGSVTEFPHYGTDAGGLELLIEKEPKLAEQLDGRLPYVAAEVVWAARHTMARTVEDVLARRTRSLFLEARAAIACAPKVAHIMAGELGRSVVWEEEQVREFTSMATNYLLEART
jgi:glycerol-3-phosphate dehydrogenase